MLRSCSPLETSLTAGPLTRLRQLLLAALALGAAAPLASADTLRVPQDQPTIQAALDAAGEGDVVLISAGSYPGELTLSGKTSVTLRGKGQVLLVPPVPAVELPTLLEVTSSRALRVEGLRFVGLGQGSGLVLDGCTGVSVTRCEFTELTTGLWAEDTAGLALTRSRFEDDLRGVELLRVRRSLVQRNTLAGSTTQALRARDCEELTVERNQVSGGTVGLTTDGSCLNVLLLDNKVRDCDTGLSIAGSDVQVDGHTVSDCGEGLTLGAFAPGSSLSVSGNRISRCSGDGIASTAGSVVLRDNTIKQCGDTGLHVISGSLLAEGNRISACAAYGVHTNEALVTLAGNRVRHNGEFDLFAVYPSSTVLLDNSFKTFGSTF